MIDGLEQKLQGLQSLLDKTERDTKIYLSYKGIADQLQKDI